MCVILPRVALFFQCYHIYQNSWSKESRHVVLIKGRVCVGGGGWGGGCPPLFITADIFLNLYIEN